MIGERFGIVTVICAVPAPKYSRRKWKCRCDCGTIWITRHDGLKAGTTKSCGCLRRKAFIARATTHGASTTREYKIWQAMHLRCTSANTEEYKNYGGRGITVCRRWKKFEAFLSDMGVRPNHTYSIDRVNNNGNYEPKNCRWATKREQALNTRRNRRLAYHGLSLTVEEWARELGISRATMFKRVKGWTKKEKIFAYGKLRTNGEPIK